MTLKNASSNIKDINYENLNILKVMKGGEIVWKKGPKVVFDKLYEGDPLPLESGRRYLFNFDDRYTATLMFTLNGESQSITVKDNQIVDIPIGAINFRLNRRLEFKITEIDAGGGI